MSYAATTSVAFEKSVSEITALVRKAGAVQIGQMEDVGWFTVAFKLDDRAIRFRLVFPSIDDMPKYDGNRRPLSNDQRMTKLDQAKRQRGRALLLVIKAKLESVESGIETIEEAFLPHIVLMDGRTVYERVSEQIAIEYQEQRPSVAGLLEGPRP